MEYISYQLVSDMTDNINTGSYLSKTEYSMFTDGFSKDLWYGFSANDIIELGVFDYEQNQLKWDILNQSKKYNTNTYSYFNTLDFPVQYSYLELKPDFILYKNDKILISPPTQLSQSFNISNGNYILTYNFMRNMAGTSTAPLAIKDISTSRTEVKLVPVGSSTLQYDAFCKNKFLMEDVSPLYLQLTNNCPYSEIYNSIYPLYVNEINTIKTLFFLNTDGDVINFLKNIYEDFIIYTDSEENPEKLFPSSITRAC